MQQRYRLTLIGAFALAALATVVHAAPAPSPQQVKALKTGDTVQDLTLLDMAGKTIRLRRELERSPAVIVFFRGQWCPYCTSHLKDLRNLEGELKRLGYQLLAISPDTPSDLSKVAEKSGTGFRLLSDSNGAAMSAFKVGFTVDPGTVAQYKGFGVNLVIPKGAREPVLPVPAVFVVDTKGTVRFVHTDPDYRKRLEPAKVLAAARAARPSR